MTSHPRAAAPPPPQLLALAPRRPRSPAASAGTEFCAYTCDPYNLLQLDGIAVSGQSCASVTPSYGDGSIGLGQFRMTCNTGKLISQDSDSLNYFTYGYDNTTASITQQEAFDAEFTAAGSTRPCTIDLAILYIAVQCVFQAVFSVAQLSQPLQNFMKATTACNEVLEVIARVPAIDSFSPEGATPDKVKGDVEMRDVYFAYPSAPDVNICNGYSLVIPAGSSCALVGPSGSGKSTIIQLLERFYDPAQAPRAPPRRRAPPGAAPPPGVARPSGVDRPPGAARRPSAARTPGAAQSPSPGSGRAMAIPLI